MFYFREDNTVQELNEFFDLKNIGAVGLATETDTVVYHNKNWQKEYLTFEAREAGTFKFSGSSSSNKLYYSLDEGNTWTLLNHNTNSPTIQAGHTIMWKGSGLEINMLNGIGKFISSGRYDAMGNVMSIVYDSDFEGEDSLEGMVFVFRKLFGGATGLTDVSFLSLPAMTLENYCYDEMFLGCSNLVSAPILPASSLSQYCYCNMFQDCSSLTTAPILVSEDLAIACYWGMFIGCTSLVNPPVLASTTIANSCYRQMFSGCTSLTTPPSLPATTLANYCYANMFADCVSLTKAPDLLAQTLVSFCYNSMFDGCSSLSYIKCLATDISAGSCTAHWTNNVSGAGTFVKDANMTDWKTGVFGIDGIPEGWVVVNEGEATTTLPPGPQYQWLTFVAREAGTFKFSGSTTSNTLQYSLDNGSTWSTLAHNTDSPSVASGGTIMWKASGLTIDDESYEPGIGRFRSSGAFDVKGNVMSLLYGDNFIGEVSLENKENAFSMLFDRCSGVTSANGLSLPATALSEYCYYAMFRGCTSLTDSMQTLPATTLASDCYCEMFENCSALTTTPELPATTLDVACYAEMFEGCSSLTSAPELPATSLAPHCYRHMFGYCTNLTNAPTLGLTALTGTYCYFGMFRVCTSLVNAPALPATILSNGCYCEMFAGCTSIVSAPALPATTVNAYCYNAMFSGCTSLVNAPALPATNLSGATNCYAHMFSGCTSLVNAPALPATTLANSAYSNMFISCTALTHAPVLSAETLATSCYTGMFSGCSSLSSITCLATDMSATDCTKNWVAGVASGGIFYGDPNTNWTTGVNGIPTNWTRMIPHEDEYLTFVAHENSTFKFFQLVTSITIQYSTNGGTSWSTLPMGTATPTIASGESIMWKCNNAESSHDAYYGLGHFTSTGTYHVKGNVMSMLYGDNFIGEKDLTDYDPDGDSLDCLFCHFQDDLEPSSEINNTKLVSAKDLVLPATVLATYSYDGMFSRCVNLVDAPTYMPATTLADSSCVGMFTNCSSLVNVPRILPATTLSPSCYESMFINCTSLEKAPELPATTLTGRCYGTMFSGCSSLNHVKCLAMAIINTSNTTYNWMLGVPTGSTGTFIKNSNATVSTDSTGSGSKWPRSIHGIPVGWTVEDA